MDKRNDEPSLFESIVPLHENIRGCDYYNQEEA